MKKVVLALAATIIAPLAAQAAAVSAAPVDVFPNRICNKAEEASGSQAAACKDSKAGKTGSPLYGPNGVITILINILSILVGIAAVIGIILGGMKLITSGSNPQEVTKGREYILYALIGLIVAAIAQVLVRFFLSKIAT